MRKLEPMADRLMDPDDLRPVYVRIAEKLREAYEPGVQLPSVPTIAQDWGVARETVRSAIDLLRSEGLVVSWQGRGTFYRTPAETDDEVEDDPVLQRLDEIMTRLDGFEARIAELEKSREQ